MHVFPAAICDARLKSGSRSILGLSEFNDAKSFKGGADVETLRVGCRQSHASELWGLLKAFRSYCLTAKKRKKQRIKQPSVRRIPLEADYLVLDRRDNHEEQNKKSRHKKGSSRSVRIDCNSHVHIYVWSDNVPLAAEIWAPATSCPKRLSEWRDASDVALMLKNYHNPIETMPQ